MNLNFPPSPFPLEKSEKEDAFSFGLHQQNIIGSSSSSSSSSSPSCLIFVNPTQDHKGFYHPQLYQPQDECYHGGGGSSYDEKDETKIDLWKKQDQDRAAALAQNILVKNSTSTDGGGEVKWRPRLMTTTKHEEGKIEVMKKVKLWSSNSELSNSTTSYSYNCNSPIRVCSDCHTTKTPLWRSGPKGPKSLCNACGIRQRKARRAMAAAVAVAAAGGGGLPSDYLPRPPRGETAKVKVKVKMGKSGVKKRCKVSNYGGSSSSKMGLEDFLKNLSNKLAIHRVFPQDEKEAAILLMALSSGLVHG